MCGSGDGPKESLGLALSIICSNLKMFKRHCSMSFVQILILLEFKTSHVSSNQLKWIVRPTVDNSRNIYIPFMTTCSLPRMVEYTMALVYERSREGI